MARNGVRLVKPFGMPSVVCRPFAALVWEVVVFSVMTPTVARTPGARLAYSRQPLEAPEVTASSRGILYPARLPEFHRVPPPATAARGGTRANGPDTECPWMRRSLLEPLAAVANMQAEPPVSWLRSAS